MTGRKHKDEHKDEHKKKLPDNGSPHIAINAQYIKDLSFENPGAPATLAKMVDPEVELYLDLNIIELHEADFYEVVITIEAKTKNKDTIYYILDLKYAGIFQLINIPDDQKQMILAIHCPTMIFPFARKIVADATQDGGFQPLLIDPIDFGTLYNKKLKELGN